MLSRVINRILNKMNSLFNVRLTFHSRSLFFYDYFHTSLLQELPDDSEVGIVVQGPIHSNSEVTLNTLLLYKRLFPKSFVVLSTWQDVDPELVQKIKNDGIEVVLSPYPVNVGAHNVNLQILSTQVGIEASVKKGCKYILKTRTDMRFSRYTTLSSLIKLLDMFRSAESSSSAGRIIEVGSTACRFRPWSLCDVFQFGHSSDMSKFWSVELDSRNSSASEFFSQPRTAREVSEHNVAEIYLHRKYADALGYNTNVDPEDYYAFIKSEILIIDKEMIDLTWFKYDSFEYSWVGDPLYSSNQTLSRINFSEWLLIYSGSKIDIKTANKYLELYER